MNLTVPTNILCCYPFEQKFIAAHVELIKNTLKQLSSNNFRIIFSAHGLPQSIINKGDPYEWQINTTVEHIIKYGNFDSKKCRISYQSKVTPVKWLEPNTEDEIKIAGNDNLSVVIVPIAFVSEHSETLVELDIEYRDIAREFGVKEYLRVPTLSCNSLFMESLHSMIIKIANTPLTSDITSSSGMRICPVKFTGCPNTTLEL